MSDSDVELAPITDVSSFKTQEEIDAAIRARISVVERLQEDILLLRSHRNILLSPATCLPNELLTKVFRLFVSEYLRDESGRSYEGGPPTHRYPYQWLRITLVCRCWRAVALDMADLWVRLPITERSDCFRACRERSQNKPLTILPGSFGLETELNFDVFIDLLSATERVQHLSLFLTKRLLRDLADMNRSLRFDPDTGDRVVLDMPMLETLALVYPATENERNNYPPHIFWFVSDAPLPRLHSLWLDGVYHLFFRKLVRPTLTRLRVYLREDNMSCSDWVNLLEVMPLLEDFELVLYGDPLLDNVATPVERRIPMTHLRKCSFTETEPGILPARIMNHLDTPSDCILSITFDNFHAVDNPTCAFTLEAIGSKLNGVTSIGGSRLPQSMLLSEGLSDVTLAFWPLEDRDCTWARSYRKPDFDGEQPTVSFDFRKPYVEEEETNITTLVMDSVRSSALPISDLTSLTLDVFRDDLEQAAWDTLARSTQLRNLSWSDAVSASASSADCIHRSLIARLSGSPLPFPHLRHLYMGSVRWHIHHGGCTPPYADEPLSVKLEELLTARRTGGQPIERLQLTGIRHLNRNVDLAWLEGAASGEHTAVSWTQEEGSGSTDWCTTCDRDEWSQAEDE